MALNFTSLREKAVEIKNEIRSSMNSSSRVGMLFGDMIDKIEEAFTTLGQKLNKSSVVNQLSDSIEDVPSVKLVKDNLVQLESDLNSNSYNVSQANNKYDYATSIDARSAVPANLRKKGLTISYQLSSGIWITERYNQWLNDNILDAYFYDKRNWEKPSTSGLFKRDFVAESLNALKSLNITFTDKSKESGKYFLSELYQVSILRALRIRQLNNDGTYTQVFSYTPSQASLYTGYESISVTQSNGDTYEAYVNWDESPNFTNTTNYDFSALMETVYKSGNATNLINRNFVTECSNKLLLDLITDIKIYNGDSTHQYIISGIEITLTRVQIRVIDLTLNKLVGYFSVNFTGVTEFKNLPDFIFIGNQAVEYRGIYPVVKLDLSKVTSAIANKSYTTIEEGGISPECVRTPDFTNDFNHVDKYAKVIRVRQDGSGDFTTLTAAIQSLLYYGNTEGLTYRIAKTSYDNQVIIELGEGTFYEYNLYIPQFVCIRGSGIGRTIIKTDETKLSTTPTPVAMLQSSGFCKVENITLESTVDNYCLHSDQYNRFMLLNQPNTLRIRNRYRNVEFVGSGTQNAMTLGIALSALEETLVESCINRRTNGLTNYLMQCHTGQDGSPLVPGGIAIFRNTRWLGNIRFTNIAADNNVKYSSVLENCRVGSIDVGTNWTTNWNGKILTGSGNVIGNQDDL